MLERSTTRGLRVLVTAGASGIGRAIAEAFAADGARVFVSDIDAPALEGHPFAGGVVCDVADEAAVGAMVAEAVETLGGLDVLVNNAGIAGPTGGVDAISPADWRRCIDVNLHGQFYCAHHAVPHLRRAAADSGDGAMVNLASVAGRLGYAFRTPYAASKWAVVGFTQSLAKELGPDGIRVNAILPGIVEGRRIEGVIRARAEELGVSYAAMEAEYIGRVSLRRMVSADDVAAMAVFLCSPAGRNISGQSLSVCGNVESL